MVETHVPPLNPLSQSLVHHSVRGALLRVVAAASGTVSPVEKASVQQTPKIHRGWVTVLALSGLLITALAFGGRFVTGIGEDDLAVWQSILTNFGVGLLSAAVLLLFEPKFRKVVTDTVNKATAGVKEDVREAVKADIDEKLAPITDRIDSLYDEKLTAQQALAKDLALNFTHERVMKLFREASKLSALENQALVVQGEAIPDKLLVVFQLRLPDGMDRVDEYTNQPVGPEHEALHVSVIPENAELRAMVVWSPEQSFPEVAIRLAERLNFTRGRGMAEKIDWGPILERLEKGIDAAVNASMKTPGALPLDGKLVEFLEGDQDWYLTTDGLYCPEKQYRLPRSYFHVNRRPGQPSADYSKPVPPLDAPAWVTNKSEWKYMFLRSKQLFRHGYVFV